MAMALAILTKLAAAAGYVWAARPYDAELSSLRARAELGDPAARDPNDASRAARVRSPDEVN